MDADANDAMAKQGLISSLVASITDARRHAVPADGARAGGQLGGIAIGTRL
jgi:hypothetical protein